MALEIIRGNKINPVFAILSFLGVITSESKAKTYNSETFITNSTTTFQPYSLSRERSSALFLNKTDTQLIQTILECFKSNQIILRQQKEILSKMFTHLNPYTTVGRQTTSWNNFIEEVFPFLDPKIKNKGVESVKKGKW